LLQDARPRIGFIGAGRTASALAVALSRAGYDVTSVASRAQASAIELASRLPACEPCENPQDVVDNCDLVFVTTPDEAIESTAATLRWRPGVAVVHCSGALSRDALRTAAAQGADTGCLHPLQTFASRDAAPDLRGTYFAVEAEGALDAIVRAMAEALGGTAITLRSEDRALYHASAVLASNYVVTLLKLATDLWLRFGYDRGTALQALLPLLRGAVDNLGAQGLPGALTGPVARGDVDVVRRHVEALSHASPEVLDVYRALGVAALPVGLAKGGLSEDEAAELRGLFLTLSQREREHGNSIRDFAAPTTGAVPSPSGRGLGRGKTGGA
jgi:predicted short-subunit dehydrogenase-like oxidoreductase (DUF2520 family)